MHGPTCIFWAILTPFSVQDSVFAAVEAEYMTAYMMVADQVGGLVATLDKLMATDDGDGEE